MYRYETHLHTAEGSACASTSGRDYPAAFKERGYDGIIITDHFYHGNTAPDTDLPWADYVNQYARGYEEAKKAGDEIGFKVFFGVEENFEGDEYLIYGIDKYFLIDHPEIPEWKREEMLKLVHEAGGVVMQAHPFRDRDYIPEIRLLLEGVDGIEGINTGNYANDNLAALCYARRYGLRMTAGSDTHSLSNVNDTNGGIITERPIETPEDIVRIIKDGEPIRIFYPEEMFEDIDGVRIRLPAEIFRGGAWEKFTQEELDEWYLAAASGAESGPEIVRNILRDLGQL